MLHITCCLWDSNDDSLPASRRFSGHWADCLYGGFKRNLTVPFKFIVFADRPRWFHNKEIEQQPLGVLKPNYGCLIVPFKLDVPMIVCGLDTVILKNVDHLAEYCMTADKIAAPRNCYKADELINPVVLVPAGQRRIYDEWRGENDMDWLRKQPHAFTDDFWPRDMLSLKEHKVRDLGTQGASIIYFHGDPKPDQLMHLDWVREHWRP